MTMIHARRGVFSKAAHAALRLKKEFDLSRLRARLGRLPAGSMARCGQYDVRINDGPNYYILYKDIFLRRIYHFESKRPDPLILDCGSNIGMSVLYFKQVYPHARVVGFEPDPSIFTYLQENVTQNRLADVDLVRAAVGSDEGTLAFYSDGKYASSLEANLAGGVPLGWKRYEVPCVRLSEYLDRPVDFMKMNVEGAELSALEGAGERLGLVDQMVIEYHHLPGLPRDLHKILELLEARGFDYLINDFDSETNPEVNPPVSISRDTRYFLLIYARRMD